MSFMSLSPDKNTAVLEQKVILLQQELDELKESEQLKNELNERVIEVLLENWRLSNEEKTNLMAQIEELQHYKKKREADEDKHVSHSNWNDLDLLNEIELF